MSNKSDQEIEQLIMPRLVIVCTTILRRYLVYVKAFVTFYCLFENINTFIYLCVMCVMCVMCLYMCLYMNVCVKPTIPSRHVYFRWYFHRVVFIIV